MLQLTVEKRDTAVKPKALRSEGKIPAVFYGRKEESTPIVINLGEFKQLRKEVGESTVITLKTPEKEVSVLVHEVAKDPVSGDPIHADFYVVEADKEVEVNVVLEFEGEAPAEKLGGVLTKVKHEIEVRGLPKDLPNTIVVDLTTLENLDDHITVSQLPLPTGITVTGEVDEIVVSISAAKEEEEEAPAESFDATSVEVAQKGKKEDEEEKPAE